MTADVRQVLADATDRLAAAGVGSPRFDAEELWASVCGVPRAAWGRANPATGAQIEVFGALVSRRARREPLQYITGTAAFRYVELAVGPGVFVPRPETELVAGAAIDELNRRAAVGETPRATDLCTGSGAIAVALATEVPTAEVVAVELTPEAYAYARRNVDGTAVDLRLGDIADAVDDLDRTQHVVVANPPYIPLDAYDEVAAEARDYDPPRPCGRATTGSPRSPSWKRSRRDCSSTRGWSSASTPMYKARRSSRSSGRRAIGSKYVTIAISTTARVS